MKLKSLQMLWAITLPFKRAYDMLATFNEILSKCHRQTQWDSMLKLNLKNCLRKFVLYLPVIVMVCETHLQARNFSSKVTWTFDAKKDFCFDPESVFPVYKVIMKLPCLCLCLPWQLRIACSFTHWHNLKLKSFLFNSVVYLLKI